MVMDASGTTALTDRHGSLQNDTSMRRNDEVTAQSIETRAEKLQKTTAEPPPTASRQKHIDSNAAEPKKKECDRLRPEEDRSRSGHLANMSNMSSALVGQAVTPFMREHVPGIYAPIGKADNHEISRRKHPNSKYCWRHRPDSKCRKAADEKKMAMIQSELDKLPSSDQQAITHVWSLFSAAPSKHRDLMLQGIMTQCCFFQLSTVAREVEECLKIDFLVALPVELSQKILCYLDTDSLLKAAQVSQKWRLLADSDAVWVHMCQQHIDRKCTRCGWGLPKLERKRLRDYTRQRQLAQANANARVTELSTSAASHPSPTPSASSAPPSLSSQASSSAPKRNSSCLEACDDSESKRQCTKASSSMEAAVREKEEPKMKPWKMVYRDRWRVATNWRYGRCSVKILTGHANGVTALQIQDNYLATGSYDATIKIWDLSGSEPEELRTLRGHTRGIRTLQFDENKLISGSLDSSIKIWDWHKGQCLSTLQAHTDGVIGLSFENDLLASGSIDKSLKIFQFKTKETFCLKGHTDWVNSVRLDSASRTVFSASDDFSVKLWDLELRRVIRTFEGHVGHVQAVLALPSDYEPDDEVLHPPGVVPDNSDARSTTSGRGASPPARCDQYGSSPAPDDDTLRYSYGPPFVADPERPLPPRYILTSGLDAAIRLWDTSSGKCLKTLFGHVEGIWNLAGDSLRIASAANDGMVKIWDPRSGKCERTFTGHRGPVTCISLSESRMASGSEDGEVRLYSFQNTGRVAEVGTPN